MIYRTWLDWKSSPPFLFCVGIWPASQFMSPWLLAHLVVAATIVKKRRRLWIQNKNILTTFRNGNDRSTLFMHFLLCMCMNKLQFICHWKNYKHRVEEHRRILGLVKTYSWSKQPIKRDGIYIPRILWESIFKCIRIWKSAFAAELEFERK